MHLTADFDFGNSYAVNLFFNSEFLLVVWGCLWCNRYVFFFIRYIAFQYDVNFLQE